jgi:hypothetical protein
MSNKIFRFEKLAGIDVNGRQTKAWCKPISLIRKKGKASCNECFFHNKNCGLMHITKQLPECVQGTSKKVTWYHWIKIRNKK